MAKQKSGRGRDMVYERRHRPDQRLGRDDPETTGYRRASVTSTVTARATSCGDRVLRGRCDMAHERRHHPIQRLGRDDGKRLADINGTGDFNGDGKSDILWRHTSAGRGRDLVDERRNLQSNGLVGTPGNDRQIAAPGDFNGDGKSDILWRHISGGAVAIWLMNGFNIQSNGLVGTPWQDWQIVKD